MDDRIEETLRRCPEGTREALLDFKATGNVKALETFALGIIARNIDEAHHETLQTGGAGVRMIDDLGIDSLTMMEIAMTFEDALEIELIDDELKGLETLGDMRAELLRKVTNAPEQPKADGEPTARISSPRP